MDLALLEIAWGWVGLAWTPDGLACLALPEPTASAARARLRQRLPEGRMVLDFPQAGLRGDLHRYFRGEPVTFDLPLDLERHPLFYRRCWEAIRAVPYGQTITYGEVATRLGQPRAARTVGAAMAANPIPIVVPCHRVVGAGGRLVGYRGGLSLKARLLRLEGSR